MPKDNFRGETSHEAMTCFDSSAALGFGVVLCTSMALIFVLLWIHKPPFHVIEAPIPMNEALWSKLKRSSGFPLPEWVLCSPHPTSRTLKSKAPFEIAQFFRGDSATARICKCSIVGDSGSPRMHLLFLESFRNVSLSAPQRLTILDPYSVFHCCSMQLSGHRAAHEEVGRLEKAKNMDQDLCWHPPQSNRIKCNFESSRTLLY
mmetsp:Transcript_12016/g.23970  ORF Transcript_12016/g.23970 Transcript_12016/m.23970 type:complete len:204 (+) Transcript_12016:782-1393(+)